MNEIQSPGAVAALGASETDQLGRQVVPETNREQSIAQASIPATPVGDDFAEAQGRRNDPHAGNEQLDPASVLDHDEERRLPDQEKSYQALNGEGGLSSGERVLSAARPENRLDILKNALSELFPLAKAAAVSSGEIEEWAVRQSELYNIAEPDELRQIIARAKADSETPADRLRPLNLREFLELSLKPREMLLDPILPEKGLAMLYAARGTGKTFVALCMAFAIATATLFLKWKAPKPRRVLLIDGEMPAAALQERWARIVASAPDVQLDPGNIQILAGDLIEEGGIGNLASPDVQAEIDRWLEGVDVLILDNLSSLTAVIRDNDAESWGPIQEWLLRLRRRGIAVLIVHHAGKGGQQRGTSRREDVLDTSISLRHPADYSPTEGARFEVHLEKARGVHGDAARPFEAKLEVRDGKAIWTVRELEDVNRARVRALLDDGVSLRDIADETGISKSTVQRIKKAIEASGGDNAA
jgi:AAA domain/Homeodomain-like domain